MTTSVLMIILGIIITLWLTWQVFKVMSQTTGAMISAIFIFVVYALAAWYYYYYF